MKILVFGGTGTIGSAVVKELSKRHEVLVSSRSSELFGCDITDTKSIEALFAKTGKVDAVVVSAGSAHVGHFIKMDEDDFYVGIKNKLMGQINIVRIGVNFLNDEGSFTLTSGVLTHDPTKQFVNASMVNGAIESFIKAVSIELPPGIRINAVSPGLLEESVPKIGHYFRGFEPVSSTRVALGFSKSVEGSQTGQIYQIS